MRLGGILRAGDSGSIFLCRGHDGICRLVIDAYGGSGDIELGIDIGGSSFNYVVGSDSHNHYDIGLVFSDGDELAVNVIGNAGGIESVLVRLEWGL